MTKQAMILQHEAITLSMLRDENTWPQWPVLPLKHATKLETVQNSPGRLCGVVLAGAGLLGAREPAVTVYHINMFAMRETMDKETSVSVLSGVPKDEYATAEDVVKAGWLVD